MTSGFSVTHIHGPQAYSLATARTTWLRETNHGRIDFYLNTDRVATDIPHETELGPMSNKNEKFKLAFKKKKKN